MMVQLWCEIKNRYRSQTQTKGYTLGNGIHYDSLEPTPVTRINRVIRCRLKITQQMTQVSGFQIWAIWGQSEPIWMRHLTSLDLGMAVTGMTDLG